MPHWQQFSDHGDEVKIRQFAKRLLPDFAVNALRALLKLDRRQFFESHSLSGLGFLEMASLVRRMDAGDYDFDPEMKNRMCDAWRSDPNSVPYPTALKEAYDSHDAFAMNVKPLMEITYRLPYSHAYEATQRAKYQNFVAACADKGINFSGARVADVGCGYGGLLEIVREKYPTTQLCGVECASSAIEYMARNRPYVKGVVADIEAPTAEFTAAVGSGIDVVLCTEVLEHLARPEQALANLIALRPARGIALTVPNGRVDTAAQHINFWSPESWQLFVRRNAAGWRVTTGRCDSPGSPGGYDNLAVLLPEH